MTTAPPAPPVNPGTVLQSLLAFKRTAMLRTAFELGVYDALADGPALAGQVAQAVGAPEHGVAVLLGAMLSAGLLEGDGGKYRLPAGGERFLLSSSPGYLGGAARVAASYAEWDALRDLTSVIRNGGTLLDRDANAPGFAYWEDFAANGTFATRPGAELVSASLAEWASEREELRVLDVGCGHLRFGLQLAADFPAARVTGIDWENVLDYARRNAAADGLAERVDLIAGDVFEAPLGGPYDVIVVANVMPQFSVERGTELLRRLGGVLAPGGRLVIAGFTVGDQAPASEFGAWMLSLLMVAWTDGGGIQDAATYRRMLADAGFGRVSTHQTPNLPVRALIGAREED